MYSILLRPRGAGAGRPPSASCSRHGAGSGAGNFGVERRGALRYPARMRISKLSCGALVLVVASSADLGCGGNTQLDFTGGGGTGGDTATTGGGGAGASSGGSLTGGSGGAGGSGATGGAATGGTGGSATGGSATGGSGTGGMGGAGTGGAGTGGAGGSGPLCTPEGDFNGPPIVAPDGQWTWVSVPGAVCRTGSGTGFGVRLNPASDKLFIYFEGGGACFNGASCFGNPGSFSENNFDSWANGGGENGVFDTSNADNALKDWNAIYVPYCTGDVHAGSAKDVDVPGIGAPQNQQFVGYANVGLFLQRIVPTFADVSLVLVTGVSAGGFGAMFNYHRIAQAFCPTPAILIDDSGPPMDDKYLAPCLQDHWRKLWGLNNNLPADCADCNPPGGGGVVHYMDYLSSRYPGGRLALISSTEDSTIRQFYSFGLNDCANLNGLPGSFPAAAYTEGLLDVRANHTAPPAQWATYFLPGTTHTYLGGGSYSTTTVGNTKLIDWVADVVNGGPMAHVGP